MVKQLSWFTPPLPTTQGYGIAAVETIYALQRREISVLWNHTVPYVHINFIQPELYSGGDAQYKIGYTPWESTSIPFGWKQTMDRQDEIWTTSSFCKDVFETNGIDDVWVLPHGFDPETFKIVDRTMNPDNFIFLHIGGPIDRKGGKLVAKAFLELFDKNENVHLLMKSHGPSEARWVDQYGGYRGNIGNHPRVHVVEQDLDVIDIFKLYEVAHCCVYPTLGEGFGFIPFQAIATGCPTITTNLTGTADFADYSMPLNATWQNGYGIHEGQMAKPDYKHLCELMMNAYENWEVEKKKALHSARILHSTQTWDHIADKIIERIGLDKIEMVVEGAE